MVRSIPRNAGIEIMSTGLSMFSFFLGGGGGWRKGDAGSCVAYYLF